ncbi:SixA phosphatase family protein [Thermobifida cellulosilytica]|uniref:Phosphohistidine phosphatase n=1 Tax=Thermobifida cellulosilytica TB100 TaxID=665004 RepID=A0A147KGM2_THECS|nr:histidine phosphatase family protein [Thermobifida cellulosilytica]KUP96456.1 phosphohistidine phosphatase [Thermobifida cellulosilytica TB100]
MNRRLIVLRHAQAEHSASLPDIERPLTGEGRGQARAVGALLARERLLPDRVLCSTAKRTRQTWELVAQELPCTPEVDFEAQLYTADLDTALHLVSLVDPDVRTLLLVGHNPTVAQLAAAFDTDSGYLSFPPATAALVDLEVEWLYAAPGTGRLRLLN